MSETTPKSIRRIGLICVALGALFYFYEYFLRVSPSVMKPQMIHEFNIDAALFGTLSAFYFYAYTPMQLVVGILVDRIRLRFVLTGAVLACVLGTLLLANSSDFYIACAGRFLQGIGSAFAYVGALKLASMWLPVERFGFFAGLTTALGFIGAAAGEVFLSQLLDYITWRQSLMYFSITGVVIAVLFWIFLNRKLVQKARHLKVKKLHMKEYWWQFYLILKQPRIWVAGLLSGMIFLPTTVFAGLWGVPYLIKLHGFSAHEAAGATAFIFIGWAVGAPIQGWISDYFGTRLKVIMVGSIVAALLSCWVLYVNSLSYFMVCALFFIFGIFSSVQVLTFAIARDLSNYRVVGMAVAFVNAITMAGGTIFQSLVGKFLELGWAGQFDATGKHHIYPAIAYEHAIVVVPIALFLAAIIALCFRSKKKIDD